MLATSPTTGRRPQAPRKNAHPEVTHVAPVLRAASAGDPAAWEALVHHFSGLITAVTWSYRLDAADKADVAQHVWLRLVENVDRVREPEALAGWIRTVAHRECQKLVNRGRREMPSTTVDDDLTAVDEPPYAALLEEERRTTLHKALQSLPNKHESMMRYLLNDPAPSYEETSSTLSMAIGSIGPTRQRCVERLRANEELLAVR
jgi:RNA polymerase sigma factor (sigma-70 family)